MRNILALLMLAGLLQAAPKAAPSPADGGRGAQAVLSPAARVKDDAAEERAKARKARFTAIDVFENVLKAQDQQFSMECEVVREEKRGADAPTRVTGTLKVRRGGYALYELTQPTAQKAVSDGKSLWVELSDVKQVMQYDAVKLKEGGNFFLDLGSSVKHYAERSVKRLILAGEGFDENAVSALELRPLKPDEAGFERMRVWVDHNGWVVRKVNLKLGNVDTTVYFEGIKRVTRKEVNEGRAQPIAKKAFAYKPPKGYEVFDLSEMQ